MSSLLKSWRFGLGYLAVVVIGSLLLLAWLREREREESIRLFQALAQADAEFVRGMNLPRSEKLATDLQRLLGMKIEFHEAGKAPTGHADSLVIRLDDKNDMVFRRTPSPSSLSLRDPATRNAFAVFWLLAGFVGWLLARERQRRAQTERLAMLGRVATSLAHDIKNPLASIQLHTQLLTPTSDEDEKAVQLIHDEAGVISGLVNQWLHLANPLPPCLTPLDLASCLAAVLKNLEAQARHAAVNIEDSLSDPLRVMGDSQRLSQALRNLIINAIHAMPLGGRLHITAEKTAGMIHLRFSDSGPGFSDMALSRGTELFYTEKEGGMGLGLNIAASIAQAHGGCLTLQNASPQGGALVTLTIPEATSQPQTAL